MKLSNVNTFLEEISADLIQAESKQEQLEYLIEIGEELEIDESLVKHDSYRVSGCASNTFVKLDQIKKIVSLKAYTDSYVVKGYLVIFQKCLTQLNEKDFDQTMQTIKQFGHINNFQVSHIPSRADAFSRIFETIQKQFRKNTEN